MNLIKLRITKPNSGDTEEIRNLFSLTIQHTFDSERIVEAYAGEIEEEIKRQLQVINHFFQTKGSGESFFIAKGHDEIVGTIASGPANEVIRNNLNADLRNVPEMKCAYVLPDYQGQGIGTVLFNRMLEKLAEENGEKFCLDCGYKSAQNFWTHRIGAAAVVLKNYHGQNAHHMIWICRVSEIAKPFD